MSSHRFPSEEPQPAQWFATDGAIGTIRAHEQAAIDQFLLFAERERHRLEARLIEAEMRCREAEAELFDATRENQVVAEQLYATWQQLQADRDRAERRVVDRLAEVRAEAEELVHWSDRRPLPAEQPPQHHAASPPSQGQPRGQDPGPRQPAAPAPPTSAAEEAFFGGVDEGDVPWARLEDPPGHVHEDLLARHPRRDAAGPAGPGPGPGPAAASGPGPAEARPQPFAAAPDQEFWDVEQSAAALRISQLEGTFMSLLPMLALVVILVVILAWIG